MASTIRADQFVELYAQDVREFPDAYKQRVRLDPEGSARSLIDGLDESEIAQMLRDLKHERRTVKKHESGRHGGSESGERRGVLDQELAARVKALVGKK